MTVAQAMLGNIGVEFNASTNSITKTLHHLPKGNAALTQKKHNTISGIFVYDLSNHGHVLFINPYAENTISLNFFPDVKEVRVAKNADQEELKKLSNIMFWNTNFK